MTRRERFFSCMARNGYDRIPVAHHYGTAEFHRKFYDRLGVDHEQFRQMVEDVFDGVGPSQTISPTTRGNPADYGEGI
ncbi:MAG: hypothetical protein ACYTFO_03285, partial [Planctomycetota bacterium]